MADAAAAYGDAGASRMFEAMIAGGDDDAIRRGFIGLGNNPTKYFDRGTAQTEISNDLQVGLDKNLKTFEADKYKTDQGLIGTKYEDDFCGLGRKVWATEAVCAITKQKSHLAKVR